MDINIACEDPSFTRCRLGTWKGLPFRANRVTGRAVVVAVQGATVASRRRC